MYFDVYQPCLYVILFEGIDVEKLMTPEEKAKLYDAIGYDEEDIDPSMPNEVMQCFSLSLYKVSFRIVNITKSAHRVLFFL